MCQSRNLGLSQEWRSSCRTLGGSWGGLRMAATLGVSYGQHWRNQTPGLHAEESDSGWALGVGIAGTVLMLPPSGAHSLGTCSSHPASAISSQHFNVDSSGNASLSLWNHSICLLIHATTMSWSLLCGTDTPWTRRNGPHTLHSFF